MSRRILIFDGMNLFLRNFAVNPHMDVNGEPIGGIVGSLRSIKHLIDESQCDVAVVAWEGDGGSQKRRAMLSEYKAGRKPRLNREYDFDSPQESARNMNVQIERLKTYLRMLGIAQVSAENCEADDCIAYICQLYDEGWQKIIVSTDRDFYQLVDHTTIVFSPTRKQYMGIDKVKAETGVIPANYILMKSVCGDKSDNITGVVKGFKSKKFLKLFPTLAEHRCELENFCDLTKKAEPQTDYLKKTRLQLLASWDKVIENYKIMQLSSPIISPQSAAKIRYQLNLNEGQNVSSFKLALIKDGVQLVDGDVFTIFGAYINRLNRMREKTNDRE